MYCLPLYDPLRLIEEVWMLDQLSRGRFDFGVGRGIVPYEMAYFNLHHLETEEIYKEALDVILQGLQSELLDHRGPRYTYRKVPIPGGIGMNFELRRSLRAVGAKSGEARAEI